MDSIRAQALELWSPSIRKDPIKIPSFKTSSLNKLELLQKFERDSTVKTPGDFAELREKAEAAERTSLAR